jgi:polysaccharide export outer membrane protein
MNSLNLKSRLWLACVARAMEAAASPMALGRALHLCLVGLVFCGGMAAQEPQQEQQKAKPQQVQAQPKKRTDSARKLGPGDAITVMVFREPELSGEFKVNEQGTINYPLLGKISVSGRSPEQVSAEIESLLEKDYVRDAQVSIDMIGKGAIQISVLGEVRAPGRFPFEAEERVELGTALLVAGGPTESSNLAAIEIKRRNGEDIQSLRVSMPADKSFVLQRDDSVIVPSLLAMGSARPLVTVLGQVARPGAMEMPAGRDLDLLTAIALAGGMTPTARGSKVTIRREGEAPVTINVDRIQKGEIPSPVLKGGDTVFVPESIF